MTDDCDPIAEFDKLFCLDDKVDNGQRQFDVFISKEGDKPIIVVHELPGMTKPFLCYCIKMANQGFKVYAPLMFGKMGKAKSSLQMLSLCISSEFRKLYWRNQTEGQPESQFTRWVLHLAGVVSSRHESRKVGVIGMCLTGSFALVTFAEPAVNSVVCCQPAFPFVFRESLGLTKTQQCNVRREVNKLGAGCAQGYRYKNAPLSRQSHVDSTVSFMNDDGVERFTYKTLKGCKHSVVTDKKRNLTTENDILEFVNARLS